MVADQPGWSPDRHPARLRDRLTGPCHAVAFSRLALIFLSLGTIALAAGEPSPPVVRGLSAAEVRQRLGPPARVSRQILFRRHLEQWVYEEPKALRVEFNCVRGEEPVVCAVLQLPPARP
jgi:hypothetical protein